MYIKWHGMVKFKKNIVYMIEQKHRLHDRNIVDFGEVYGGMSTVKY